MAVDLGKCEADVAVVGGGSAGFAAAWAAARLGSRVVLVEKAPVLGGTSTYAGVSNWEPGVCSSELPELLYRRMSRTPGACGLYVFDRHCAWRKPWEPYVFPGALLKVDPTLPYSKSLRRHGPGMADEAWFRANCHGVIFEPEALASAMAEMLDETGRCQTFLGTAMTGVRHRDGHVEAVELSNGAVVKARCFIDATDGALCSRIGCGMMFGRDARSAFNEPGAPEKPLPVLNGATLLFRVAKTGTERVESLPADVPSECWWGAFPLAFMMELPCGDIAVNMLPTMAGAEALRLGEEAAYAECARRVRAEWHWLQENYAEFRRYRLKSAAKTLALRETRRVRGKYVLNQNDLIAGLSGQCHGDIVALADHPMDNHGGGGPCGELREPYGIPFRCLEPLGADNVLVAGRAASFSAIAASSCRLSRTMMALGEAAGRAAHTLNA